MNRFGDIPPKSQVTFFKSVVDTGHLIYCAVLFRPFEVEKDKCRCSSRQYALTSDCLVYAHCSIRASHSHP